MIICNRYSGWQQLIFKFFFCFQKKNKLPHSTHRTVAICHWHCIPSIRDWFVTCSSRFYSKSSSPIATYSLSFTELWIVRLNMYCTTAVLGWINFPFFFHFTNQMRRYVPRMSEQVSPWIHYKLKQFNFLSNRGTYIYFWSNSKSDFMFF